MTKPSSLRITLALTASLACTLALAACGTKQDVTTAPATARPFTVMLDWFPNADHAPLYAAIAHGDFRAVGLDVQPVVPPKPRNRSGSSRPARSTWRSPTSPSCCSRAIRV